MNPGASSTCPDETGRAIVAELSAVNDQRAHGQPIEVTEFAVQLTRDTLENWQSEFLQLLWQVAGLTLLLHVGSPQSKEGDDRMEAKIDAILLAVDHKHGEKAIDRLYEGRDTDTGLARRRAVRAGAERLRKFLSSG